MRTSEAGVAWYCRDYLGQRLASTKPAEAMTAKFVAAISGANLVAALQKRGAILWELGAQEHEHVERMLMDAPTAAAFRQSESLRDR